MGETLRVVADSGGARCSASFRICPTGAAPDRTVGGAAPGRRRLGGAGAPGLRPRARRGGHAAPDRFGHPVRPWRGGGRGSGRAARQRPEPHLRPAGHDADGHAGARDGVAPARRRPRPVGGVAPGRVAGAVLRAGFVRRARSRGEPGAVVAGNGSCRDSGRRAGCRHVCPLPAGSAPAGRRRFRAARREAGDAGHEAPSGGGRVARPRGGDTSDGVGGVGACRGRRLGPRPASVGACSGRWAGS